MPFQILKKRFKGNVYIRVDKIQETRNKKLLIVHCSPAIMVLLFTLKN